MPGLLSDLMPSLVLHTGIGGDVVIPLDPTAGGQTGSVTLGGVTMPYDVALDGWEPVVIVHAPTGDVIVRRQSGVMSGVIAIGSMSVPYDIVFGAYAPAAPSLFGLPLGTAVMLGGIALVVLYFGVRGR